MSSPRLFRKAHQLKRGMRIHLRDWHVLCKPIKIVDTFKHLGRVTAKNNDDGEAVKQNLGRGRKNGRACCSGSWFLIQDDPRPKTMAVFHRTVVLCVLLYGSESWLLMKGLMRQLP
jgi:hypothetical protein